MYTLSTHYVNVVMFATIGWVDVQVGERVRPADVLGEVVTERLELVVAEVKASQ